jgi:hypothetical protein
MDPYELRQFSERDYYDFWESEDGRDRFEEPWNWAWQSILTDFGDYEAPWDDVARRERMAEAIYET